RTQTRIQGVQETPQAGAARRRVGLEPRQQAVRHCGNHPAHRLPLRHLGRAGGRREAQARRRRDLFAGPRSLIVDSPPPLPAIPAQRLGAAVCFGMMLMLALSWPLWVEVPAFPRVPFVAWSPRVRATASWVLFALLIGSVTAAAAGIAWRRSLALSLVLLV